MQLFISQNANALRRWRQAFPEAQIVADVDAVAGLAGGPMGGEAILWLDVALCDQQPGILTRLLEYGAPVVVMAAVPSEAEGFSVMRSGAMGYCHLLAAPQQLQEIAVVVAHGGFWVGPDLMQRVMKASFGSPETEPSRVETGSLDCLTEKEHQVAAEVAKGANNKDIAETLNITERTVKAHLTVIFEKLQIKGRVQLALLLNGVVIS